MSYPVYDRLVAWFGDLKGDYITRDEVRRFIADEKADPIRAAELGAFADVLVYNALMQRAVSERSREKHRTRRSVEAQSTRRRLVDAAERISAGQQSGLLSLRYKVDDKGTIRTGAEMNGADHTYVARHYADNSRRSGLFAAFHKAVARKCGRRRTDEVFTAEQYEAMYRSIVAADPPANAA